MKALSLLLLPLLALAVPLHAHDNHEKVITGPNGGRVITSVEPHLEFLVTQEGKVKIIALAEDNKKQIALTGQSVRLTGGKRTSPTRLSFAEQDGALISDGTLPDSMSIPVVLQIKASAESKAVLEKFQLNLEECADCEYKKYACDSGHDHDHKHDHEHDHKHEKK